MEFLLKNKRGSHGHSGPVFCGLALLTLFFLLSTTGAAESAGIDSDAKREAVADGEKVLAGDFSMALIYGFAPWKALVFPGIARHTKYVVEGHDRDFYLRAVSESSASALYRDLDLNLGEFPVLSWRWKIKGILQKGDARTKSGDDYAARLYVTFAFDESEAGLLERTRHEAGERLFGQSLPGSTINYIWANRLKKGSFIFNSYSERSMMIAVESGDEKSGIWVTEERNVYEDYLKAFGRKPPPVTGIAIMTDSDNTGGSATGYYDDIYFTKTATKGQEDIRP